MKIIEVRNLYKYYGEKLVLNSINLSFGLGEIVGLFGPNGSGKTTLLKLIIGLLKPSFGEILIDGVSPNVYTRSIISFLPDINILPSWMRIKDAFNFYKDFFVDFDEERFEELRHFFELKPEEKIRNLSKGETEKLLLAFIVSRKAKIYLLDEPLSGIDPATRNKLITGILKSYREDSLMIIATHLIQEIETIADRTIFISGGKIVLDESTERLREEKKMSVDELFKKTF